jgi:hypothetical protein
MDAVGAARVERDPFPYLIVPRFVRAEALEAIRADFPQIAHPGSFPLSTLDYGPAFAAFMDEIQGAEMTAAVGDKLGMDLAGHPTMVTVRGQSRGAAGRGDTARLPQRPECFSRFRAFCRPPPRDPAELGNGRFRRAARTGAPPLQRLFQTARETRRMTARFFVCR